MLIGSKQKTTPEVEGPETVLEAVDPGLSPKGYQAADQAGRTYNF